MGGEARRNSLGAQLRRGRTVCAKYTRFPWPVHPHALCPAPVPLYPPFSLPYDRPCFLKTCFSVAAACCHAYGPLSRTRAFSLFSLFENEIEDQRRNLPSHKRKTRLLSGELANIFPLQHTQNKKGKTAKRSFHMKYSPPIQTIKMPRTYVHGRGLSRSTRPQKIASSAQSFSRRRKATTPRVLGWP